MGLLTAMNRSRMPMGPPTGQMPPMGAPPGGMQQGDPSIEDLLRRLLMANAGQQPGGAMQPGMGGPMMPPAMPGGGY